MLKESQKLDAIAWKASKEKTSYGSYIISLTNDEKEKIYDEYELWIKEKEEEEEKRLLRGRLRASMQKEKEKNTRNRPVW
ncbi:MAG: hypothetical protein LUI87_18405 [Lachnospiraceae bacterium]|nr:hypothetical protein [Lachnospiraceae bacterium]